MFTLEYLAGIFDADGYIGVVKVQHRYYNLRMTITNNHLLFLRVVQAQFGGRVQDKIAKLSPNHGRQFQLCWNGKEAKEMLFKLMPWVFIKADQVRLAMEFPIGGGPYTSNKPEQEKIYKDLKEMKHYKFDV